MKAILINEKNRSALANQYQILTEDIEDMLPIGYYLVTSFGDENIDYDLVSPEKYAELFVFLGPIRNGYSDVAPL